jgi:glycosidase
VAGRTPATDLLDHLGFLYGEQIGGITNRRLAALLRQAELPRPGPRSSFSERDALLITYPDMVREPGVPPLQTLRALGERYLSGLINTLHILPFFPSSSDDGYAVIDYHSVDPALGGWAEVAELGRRFRLMFDAVVNHISAQSRWFQGFLRGEAAYSEHFITVAEGADLSRVVRPRALPLLTRFATPSGEKLVWTTFSADQVDLNFANPEVLLRIIETLLFYVARGAQLIRLDAIAYLWKQIGTPCIHLPQTHRVVQLFRTVLDLAAPQVALAAETNVPHAENISYFGDGSNEAQLVYNFALPPLVLHAFHTGSARTLTRWATGLRPPSVHTAFLNFLASHDGIGLNPARGILEEREIQGLARLAESHGGLVSWKNNADGSRSPYELNINYFDALSNPGTSESTDSRVDRFVGAHAVALSLSGVPAVYFHSLFGSTGWPEGVDLTGSNRAINRQRVELGRLEAELGDPVSLRSQVYSRLGALLRARASHPAFHPQARQTVLSLDEAVFALLREADGADNRVLCLQNLSGAARSLKLEGLGLPTGRRAGLVDLVSGVRHEPGPVFRLDPYKTVWLKW